MLDGINAYGGQRLKIERLHVRWARLEDNLILMELAQAVGVFAITPVGRSSRGLNIGGPPRLRAKRAQNRRWMQRACPDLHIIRLQDDAPLIRPIGVQFQDDVLKGQGAGLGHLAWEGGGTIAKRRLGSMFKP